MGSGWRIAGWLLAILLALVAGGYVLLALGAVWPIAQASVQFKALWVDRARTWWLFAGVMFAGAGVIGYLNWRHRLTKIRLIFAAAVSLLVIGGMSIATLIDFSFPIDQTAKLIGYDVIGDWSFEARAYDYGVTSRRTVVIKAYHSMGVFDARWVIVTSDVGDSVNVAPYGKDSVRVDILWNRPNDPESTGMALFKSVLVDLRQIGRHDPVRVRWP